MRHTLGALLDLLLLLLVAGTQASIIEHPGVLPKDANCSSCHANKTKGKSVHSAMAIPCTVCHLTETQGDMTTLNLVMPKEKICFACHEKSAPLPRHSPGVKAPCVECHDSHSSSRPALLREQVDDRRP
jgi:predicted CXXCH cytochrome family protein